MELGLDNMKKVWSLKIKLPPLITFLKLGNAVLQLVDHALHD